MAIKNTRAKWLADVAAGAEIGLPSFYSCKACQESTGECACRESKTWHHYEHALYPGIRRKIRVVFTAGVHAWQMSKESILWVVAEADRRGWKTVYLVLDLSYGDTICMLNAGQKCTAYNIGYSGRYVCMANLND